MSASVALAAGRVALVVGNSSYSHIARLPNPENEAARVRRDDRAGCGPRASLNEALRVFTRESVGADVALVFYAGHGLEMDGVNYLVPVDARLKRDTDVRFETAHRGPQALSRSQDPGSWPTAAAAGRGSEEGQGGGQAAGP